MPRHRHSWKGNTSVIKSPIQTSALSRGLSSVDWDVHEDGDAMADTDKQHGPVHVCPEQEGTEFAAQYIEGKCQKNGSGSLKADIMQPCQIFPAYNMDDDQDNIDQCPLDYTDIGAAVKITVLDVEKMAGEFLQIATDDSEYWSAVNDEREQMYSEILNDDKHEESDGEEQCPSYEPVESGVPSGQETLFPGSSVTLAVAIILIYSFVLRHNLTGECMSDLLLLLNVLCLKQGNAVWLTVDMFKQFLKDAKYPIKFHYYCSNCGVYVENKEMLGCQTLACVNTDFKQSGSLSYFLEVPLASQLKGLFERDDFCVGLEHRFKRDNSGSYQDIYDGSVYKNLFIPGKLAEKNNVSLMWNTDGVPVFKSSNFSIWPLYFVVNELPYKMRVKKEFMLLAGIWFGPSKPFMMTYLFPFYSTLCDLQEQGVAVRNANGEEFVCKCFLIAGTADLPAKCLVCNMVCFNGFYSCHKCYQSGRTCRTAKGGNVHVYPYQESNPDGPKRTVQSVKEDVTNASISHATERGVKGPCIFAYLPSYDFVKGTAIDTMHGIFLGMQKLLLKLWFGSENKGRPFNFYSSAEKYNARISEIKPPYNIKRAPRTLEHKQYFKAAELRSILLLYVPALYGIISEEYLVHYICLSYAIYLLNKNKVLAVDITLAKYFLQQFCSQFSALYEERYQTMNFHNLLHLAEQVESLGPLWTHSCFPFEDINGRLLKLVHGTRSVENQIIMAVSVLQKLPVLAMEYLDQTSPEKDFYEKMTRSSVLTSNQIRLRTDGDVYSIGKVQTLELGHKESCALGESFGCVLLPKKAKVFKRVRIGNQIYHSKQYKRPLARNSYTVHYTRQNSSCFGQINSFVSIKVGCIHEGIQGCSQCPENHMAIIHELILQHDHFGPGNHIKIFSPSTEYKVVAVPLSQIIQKVVFMEFSDLKDVCFVSLFANVFESD